MVRLTRLSVATLLGFFLSGCASFNPQYTTPVTVAPNAVVDPQDRATNQTHFTEAMLKKRLSELPRMVPYSPEVIRHQTVVGRGDVVCQAPLLFPEQKVKDAHVYWDGSCENGRIKGEGRFLVRGPTTEVDLIFNADDVKESPLLFTLVDMRGLRLGAGRLTIKNGTITERLTNLSRVNQQFKYFHEQTLEGPHSIYYVHDVVTDTEYLNFCTPQVCGFRLAKQSAPDDANWLESYLTTQPKGDQPVIRLTPTILVSVNHGVRATWDGKTEVTVEKAARNRILTPGRESLETIDREGNRLREAASIAQRVIDRAQAQSASPFSGVTLESYKKGSFEWMNAFKTYVKQTLPRS